jgi:hypothetical protein
MQKIGINCGYSMENRSTLQKATDFVANAMAMFTKIGKQAFMGKERDISPVLGKERIFSAPTAMILTNRDLNR